MPSHGWKRETAWSSYYLRSGIHLRQLFPRAYRFAGSELSVHRRIAGVAARDPLQRNALPFVFSDAEFVRTRLFGTHSKRFSSDGSIPYGIVGSGVHTMPCRYQPSDQEMWLLLLASEEYVLATRDKSFLAERISASPIRETAPHDPTVGELLVHAYHRVTVDLGVGKHGLLRLSNGDWNDSIVVNRFPAAQSGGSFATRRKRIEFPPWLVLFLTTTQGCVAVCGSRCSCTRCPRKSRAEQRESGKEHSGRGDGFDARGSAKKYWGWSGEKQLWLEPQPWAHRWRQRHSAASGHACSIHLDELARKPSPISRRCCKANRMRR